MNLYEMVSNRNFNGVDTVDKLCNGFDNDFHKLDKVFKNALSELTRHRKRVQDRIHDLQGESDEINKSYESKMQLHSNALNIFSHEMKKLDESFKTVVSTAIGIGDQLMSSNNQRQHAVDSILLLELFADLNGTSPQTSKIYEILSNRHKLHEASQIIKRLTEVVKEVKNAENQRGVLETQKLNQVIESTLLDEFSKAQGESGNPDIQVMRECVTALLEYNGKEKVADRFVWNVIRNQLVRAHHSSESNEEIEDTGQLFTRIKSLCKHQVKVIKAAFPNSVSSSILQHLLERIFNDPVFGIQEHLEKTLRPKFKGNRDFNEISNYLKSICSSYELTKDLIDTLAKITEEFQASLPSDETFNTIPYDFFNRLMDSAFSSHKQRYFDYELELLRDQCNLSFKELALTETLNLTGTKKLKTSSGNNLSTVVSKETETMPPVTTVSEKSTTGSNKGKEEFTKLLHLLSNTRVPNALLSYNKESVERCLIMAKGSDSIHAEISKLFSIVCQAYGNDFLLKIIQVGNSILADGDCTLPPPVEYFQLVKFLETHIHLLNEHYTEIIAPIVSTSATTQTISAEYKAQQIGQVEHQVIVGIEKVVSMTNAYIAFLLSAFHEKGDLKPKSGKISFQSTKASTNCVKFLRPFFSTIKENMGAKNFENFGEVLSKGFQNALIQHILKHKINTEGAFILMRDIDQYKEAFRIFVSLAVDETFDVLKEVASIFIVAPENLPSLLIEAKFSSIDSNTLHELVKKRVDRK